MAIGKTSGVRFEVDGKSVTKLNAAMRAVGDTEAPFLTAAMQDVGQRFSGRIASRGTGGIGGAVQFGGVKKLASGPRAMGVVKHPGARSMEFGRKYYWTGYRVQGGKFVGGRKTVHAGQRARPFVGIIAGDAATADIAPYARERLQEAILAEWERIAAGGGE